MTIFFALPQNLSHLNPLRPRSASTSFICHYWPSLVFSPRVSAIAAPGPSHAPTSLYGRIPLFVKILVGLVLGLIVGYVWGQKAGVLRPISLNILRTLLRLLATPLVFSIDPALDHPYADQWKVRAAAVLFRLFQHCRGHPDRVAGGERAPAGSVGALTAGRHRENRGQKALQYGRRFAGEIRAHEPGRWLSGKRNHPRPDGRGGFWHCAAGCAPEEGNGGDEQCGRI